MGLTRARVAIYNIDYPERRTELELLVDTGSMLTWVKRETLEQLGIVPRRRGRFRTVSGELVERDVGIAGVRYEREEAFVEVVFALEKDAEVLGVIALESLGYRVNPVTRELEYIGILAV